MCECRRIGRRGAHRPPVRRRRCPGAAARASRVARRDSGRPCRTPVGRRLRASAEPLQSLCRAPWALWAGVREGLRERLTPPLTEREGVSHRRGYVRGLERLTSRACRARARRAHPSRPLSRDTCPVSQRTRAPCLRGHGFRVSLKGRAPPRTSRPLCPSLGSHLFPSLSSQTTAMTRPWARTRDARQLQCDISCADPSPSSVHGPSPSINPN